MLLSIGAILHFLLQLFRPCVDLGQRTLNRQISYRTGKRKVTYDQKVLCLTSRGTRLQTATLSSKRRETQQLAGNNRIWGGRRGLNPRPPESQSGALPTELRPPLNSCLLYLDNGAPGRTRTFNPRLRRPMLYPVELRAHFYLLSSSGPWSG